MGAVVEMAGDVRSMLEGKGADERCRIAARLGSLFDPDNPAADARAAEELARQLVEDAIVQVRVALAHSVKHSRFLPKSLAKSIAHDVESVSVPFLEVTSVFSDAELKALAITIGEAGREAMARRAHISTEVARTLTEIGGVGTARCLVTNTGAELDATALRSIYERFGHDNVILESMSERAELPLDLVENLLTRVSRAAGRKLAKAYGMPDFTEPLVAEARGAALLKAVSRAPKRSLMAFVQDLQQRNELCPHLILRALRAGHLEFFEMAMAVRAGIPLDNARKLVRHGGEWATSKLSHKAGIPGYLRESYRDAVEMALALAAQNAPNETPENSN